MNYEDVKSWLDNPIGYSDSTLEQVFSELQAKTYGRFVPFFKSQIMNCCTLQNVWKPLIIQKIRFLNQIKAEDFKDPDYIKSMYTTTTGTNSTNSEGGSIDGISFNSSSGGSNTTPVVDMEKYIGHLKGSMKQIDRQIHYAIVRYHLNSQLVGGRSYMCGSCPLEDPSCNDCGCNEPISKECLDCQ